MTADREKARATLESILSIPASKRVAAAWNRRRQPALLPFRGLPKFDRDAMILEGTVLLNDLRREAGLPLEDESP